jgi:hypothetical protein
MGIASSSHELEDVSDRRAVKILKAAGMTRKWTTRFTTGRSHWVWSVVVILLGMVVGTIMLPFVESLPFIKYEFDLSSELATPAVMIIAVVLGAKEWSSTKREEALDKFYDRLNFTNEKLRAWQKPRVFISEDWSNEDTFEKEMYACIEIDNLEYAIQKYERGYLEPRDALRALTCFTSRCQEGSFKKTVRKIATRGGYRPNTMIALSEMCSVCLHDCQYRDAVPVIRGALPWTNAPRTQSSYSHGSR